MLVRIYQRVVFGINASFKSTMNFSCNAGATLEYFQKDKTEVSGNINRFSSLSVISMVVVFDYLTFSLLLTRYRNLWIIYDHSGYLIL